MAILRANLAELAGPIRHQRRLLRVHKAWAEWPSGSIDTHASEPSPRELVFARGIKTERFSQVFRLLPVIPDQLGPADEGMIDGTPQRLPAQRRVHAVNAAHQKIAVGKIAGQRGDERRCV